MATTTPLQSKHWCFTLNNPQPEEVINTDICTYMVYGKEFGDEGTPHYQGFVTFNNNKRLTAVKKLLPRAHWEVKSKYSSFLEASDYCKKDGVFIEFGELPMDKGLSGGKATKRKFDESWAFAKEGNFEAMDKNVLFPFYSQAKRIRQDYMNKLPDLDGVCGQWFVGPPNTGKSYTARKDNPGFYDKPANKWWDGYQGEDAVIIDDFDLGHKVLGHHLKRWADRYSFPAEHKGTTVQIRPKKIIVTSNYGIRDIFYEDSILADALERRFETVYFNKTF